MSHIGSKQKSFAYLYLVPNHLRSEKAHFWELGYKHWYVSLFCFRAIILDKNVATIVR